MARDKRRDDQKRADDIQRMREEWARATEARRAEGLEWAAWCEFCASGARAVGQIAAVAS